MTRRVGQTVARLVVDFEVSGVAAIGRYLRSGDVATRVARRRDGERHLTDLAHLGELMVRECRAASSPALVLSWLEDAASALDTDESATSRRLETESDAVRVLTVHKSKGLEFDVVLAPRLAGAFHKVESEGRYALRRWVDDGRTVVDAGSGVAWGASDECAERVGRTEADSAAEQRRLVYVALMRARRTAVAWVGLPIKLPFSSEFARLLFDRHEVDARSVGSNRSLAEVRAPLRRPRVARRARPRRHRGQDRPRARPRRTPSRPTPRWPSRPSWRRPAPRRPGARRRSRPSRPSRRATASPGPANGGAGPTATWRATSRTPSPPSGSRRSRVPTRPWSVRSSASWRTRRCARTSRASSARSRAPAWASRCTASWSASSWRDPAPTSPRCSTPPSRKLARAPSTLAPEDRATMRRALSRGPRPSPRPRPCRGARCGDLDPRDAADGDALPARAGRDAPRRPSECGGRRGAAPTTRRARRGAVSSPTTSPRGSTSRVDSARGSWSGSLDLTVRGLDGAYRIVDYKTDQLDRARPSLPRRCDGPAHGRAPLPAPGALLLGRAPPVPALAPRGYDPARHLGGVDYYFVRVVGDASAEPDDGLLHWAISPGAVVAASDAMSRAMQRGSPPRTSSSPRSCCAATATARRPWRPGATGSWRARCARTTWPSTSRGPWRASATRRRDSSPRCPPSRAWRSSRACDVIAAAGPPLVVVDDRFLYLRRLASAEQRVASAVVASRRERGGDPAGNVSDAALDRALEALADDLARAGTRPVPNSPRSPALPDALRVLRHRRARHREDLDGGPGSPRARPRPRRGRGPTSPFTWWSPPRRARPPSGSPPTLDHTGRARVRASRARPESRGIDPPPPRAAPGFADAAASPPP